MYNIKQIGRNRHTNHQNSLKIRKSIQKQMVLARKILLDTISIRVSNMKNTKRDLPTQPVPQTSQF